MITEVDAKKKLCPMSLNRPVAEPPWLCQGKDCMAWRDAVALNELGKGYCGLAGKP